MGARGWEVSGAAGVGIGVLLVVASLELAGPTPSTYPAPPADWTTLDGAWTSISQAFSALANGSWSIAFAEGVAADGHWSPPLLQFELEFSSNWSACQAQLSGVSTLTFWNASRYPSTQSATDFTSGGAPLWTFVFNGTSTWTYVASWFLGKVILNAVLEPSSPCFKFGLFDPPAYQRVFPGSELNSNAVASEVKAEDDYFSSIGDLGGPTPMPVPPEPGVAIYLPGPQLLPGITAGQPQWTVAYTTCGLDRSIGTETNFTSYYLNSTAVPSGHSYSWGGSSGPCFDTEYFVFGGPSRNWSSSGLPGHYYLWSNFSFNFLTSAVPATYTNTSLTTGLFDLSVQADYGVGPTEPSARATCGAGSVGLGNCTPPSSGWFAVLLGSHGNWLDSYPSEANGTSWSFPIVPFLPTDQLVVVLSASLNLSSPFSLNLQPTQPNPFVGSDFIS